MREYARSLKIVLLIADVVVIQGAAKEGVLVSDDELRSTIQQIREFQEGGRFSRDEYLKVLKQIRLDPGEFENEVRRQLVRRKMEALIKQGVKISDEEVQQAYRQRHERVRAAWAYADVKPVMAAVKVDDADLEPYVKVHQAQFSQPEKRKLQYVLVNPKKLAVAVSDAEAEAFYKEHAAEFEEPKRLRVAHVLVRVPPVGGSDAENAAKAKVEDVIKRAKGGEDFAKLAREISEDKASAVQGGDLGFVGPGELVAPFEQAAFALKKGEISAPVRTPFGYHAIRVLDVKEGGKTPLKEVAPKIKETLGAQKSEQAAQTRADEVRATLLSAKDFPAEAKRLGLEAQEASFGRGDALGEAGRDPQLDETLFGLAVGGVSTPIKTAGGFAIVKIVQLIPAGVPPVAEIRDRVVEAIKRERAEQQVTDKAKALVTTLGKGGDFAAAAKADGFSTGSLPLFSRSDPPKERAELEKQVLEQKRALAWDNWIRGRLVDSKVQVGGQPAALTR